MALKHFSCSKINKTFIVVQQKLSFQIMSVLTIKGNSFNWHAFFCEHHKVIPLCPCDSHLSMNLCIVGMGHFQFTLPMFWQQKLGSEQASNGVTRNFVSGSKPNSFVQLMSITFPSGEQARTGSIFVNNMAASKYLNRHRSAVHLLHISMNCFSFIFYATTCMSGCKRLCMHQSVSKGLMISLSVGY